MRLGATVAPAARERAAAAGGAAGEGEEEEGGGQAGDEDCCPALGGQLGPTARQAREEENILVPLSLGRLVPVVGQVEEVSVGARVLVGRCGNHLQCCYSH